MANFAAPSPLLPASFALIPKTGVANSDGDFGNDENSFALIPKTGVANWQTLLWAGYARFALIPKTGVANYF